MQPGFVFLDAGSLQGEVTRMTRCLPGLLILLALLWSAPAGAQSLSDDRAFELAREAHTALERSDWAAASRLAREAIAEYPDHVLAHYLLAQAALAQERWEDAVSALQTVVRLYP